MIPKVIHYCWFGHGPIPEKEQSCIDTWKKFFPDYEIKRWDESNFDVYETEFSKQAYEKKEYAFVSDYARAKILYEEGGLYLDTDVEIIKPFPEIVEGSGFMGFERRHFIGTATIAAEKGNEIIKELYDHYKKIDFSMNDESIDIITNVSVLTDIMRKHGLVLGGERQTVAGFEIFNREYFYPKKLSDDEFRVTEETCSIHRFVASWLTPREIRRGNNKIWINVARPILRRTRNGIVRIFGKERARKIELKTRNKLR